MANNKERPELSKNLLKNIDSDEEYFQNEVIRPVIKMQSDLIKSHVLHQFEQMKVDLEKLELLKKRKQITSLTQQNQQFKKELIGIVVGQFSIDELKKYHTMQKNLSKRIVQIIRNRMVDQLA